MESFYTTVAQASFTLLGLWWVLLQVRHDEWIADPGYRHAVYDVSLYFLLPGMMGLASLLAIEQTSVWRASFAILGAVGVLESAFLTVRRGQLRAARSLVRAADMLSVVLYSLVVLVALRKTLPDDVGLGLGPLEAEGLLVAGLLMLGITLAATIFVTTGPHLAPGEDPPSQGVERG